MSEYLEPGKWVSRTEQRDRALKECADLRAQLARQTAESENVSKANDYLKRQAREWQDAKEKAEAENAALKADAVKCEAQYLSLGMELHALKTELSSQTEALKALRVSAQMAHDYFAVRNIGETAKEVQRHLADALATPAPVQPCDDLDCPVHHRPEPAKSREPKCDGYWCNGDMHSTGCSVVMRLAIAPSNPVPGMPDPEPCPRDATGWCSTHTRQSDECGPLNTPKEKP